jgi:tetratricopeptide (TPR) repeat protein
MNDYNTLLKNATKARKNKNFSEAMLLYQKICQLKEKTHWDEYFYALMLFYLKKYQDSLQICRQAFPKNKNFLPLRQLYAKNIDAIVLNNANNININEIIKALDAIFKLVGFFDNYVHFDKIFLNTIQIIADANNSSTIQKISQILEKYKPDFFPDNPKIFINNEKQIELASPREEYYLKLCKIYISLNMHNEAIYTADLALNDIKKFHYNNNIWFRRLKAQALALSDNLDDAIKIYFQIIKFKSDWFLFFELADLLYQKKLTDAANFFIAKAIIQRQKPEFKVKLYAFIIQKNITLFSLSDVISIYISIYNLNNWKIKQNMIDVLKKFDSDLQLKKNIKKLEKKIFDSAYKIVNKKITDVVVIKKFNDFSGLCKSTDSKILYFICKNKSQTFSVNDKITITLSWSYNNKKDSINQIGILEEKS